MKVDKKPELFKPPVVGNQTLTKDGLNGWDIFTFDGSNWRHKNARNIRLAKIVLETEKNNVTC